MTNELVASGYNAVYGGLPKSPTFARIWQELACGPDYPVEFGHISFLTLTEMGDLAGELRLAAGDFLVDLACGAGGPGLWVASQHNARLVGIDVSEIGLEQARNRAARLALDPAATFTTGSFSAVPVSDSTADGAMTVDALQYAPDKRAAFAEITRFLRPGGRLAFTAFEVYPDRVADLPVLGDDPVADYEPLLGDAGLVVERYVETAGWRDRVMGAFSALIAEAADLGHEMGAPAFLALASEMTLTLDRDFYRRRVFVVAHKPQV